MRGVVMGNRPRSESISFADSTRNSESRKTEFPFATPTCEHSRRTRDGVVATNRGGATAPMRGAAAHVTQAHVQSGARRRVSPRHRVFGHLLPAPPRGGCD